MSSELVKSNGSDGSIEHVRMELERSRARVAVAAEALRDDLSQITRWRGWVGRYPWPALVGAVALGIWLGRRGRRTSQRA